MISKVSRKDFLAARAPKCEWTAEAAAEGLAARMPGTGDIDLAELIRLWLADKRLPQATLTQCAIHVRQVAQVPVGGAYLNPRKCLEKVLKQLTAPQAPSED
jgi:hypothetical protein